MSAVGFKTSSTILKKDKKKFARKALNTCTDYDDGLTSNVSARFHVQCERSVVLSA